MPLYIAGIVLSALGIGAFGSSLYMESKLKEPMWALVMKIATILAFVGALLLSLGTFVFAT